MGKTARASAAMRYRYVWEGDQIAIAAKRILLEKCRSRICAALRPCSQPGKLGVWESGD